MKNQYRWMRLRPMDQQKTTREIWSLEGRKNNKFFPVHVEYGKKLNAIALKQNFIRNFHKQSLEEQLNHRKLFKSSRSTIRQCSVCGAAGVSSFPIVTVIMGGVYRQCPSCAHAFVANCPPKSVLESFYSDNSNYQSTYTDKKSAKLRLQTISKPKLQWALKSYKNKFGKEPETLLDVGAGSGHFVKAARDAGVDAEGIELSQHGLKFAREMFDIELNKTDFLNPHKPLKKYDLITFWGCIEHVLEPFEMLQQARRHLTSHGMVLCEVPRLHSLSTAVQKMFPRNVLRHLKPSTHIQFFTDASLSTLFLKCGFAPVSAWYFGLDLYEMCVQLAAQQELDIESLSGWIDPLQPLIDESAASDFVALCGVFDKRML